MNKEKLNELTKGRVSGFVEKARKRKELKNNCDLGDVSNCCNSVIGTGSNGKRYCDECGEEIK